jgi:hypothetical protein
MKDTNYIHQDANNKSWKRPQKEVKFSKFYSKLLDFVKTQNFHQMEWLHV